MAGRVRRVEPSRRVSLLRTLTSLLSPLHFARISIAQLPPVPKFPNLNNSFAVTSKRSKTPRPPPQSNNSRTSTSRSPSKAPPAPPAAPSTPSRREAFTLSRSSRSPSKPTTNSPLSNKHRADSLSSQPQADHPGSPFGRKNKTMPHTSDGSPSPSKRTKTTTKNLGEGEEEEYVYPEDGGLGMEVDYEEGEEGDRTINGVERLLDGDAGGMEEEEEEGDEGDGEGEEQEEEEMEEEVWVRDEKDLVSICCFDPVVRWRERSRWEGRKVCSLTSLSTRPFLRSSFTSSSQQSSRTSPHLSRQLRPACRLPNPSRSSSLPYHPRRPSRTRRTTLDVAGGSWLVCLVRERVWEGIWCTR